MDSEASAGQISEIPCNAMKRSRYAPSFAHTRSLPRPATPPPGVLPYEESGWNTQVHPNGTLYFVKSMAQPQNGSLFEESTVHLATPSDVRDPQTLQLIDDQCGSLLQKFIRLMNRPLPPRIKRILGSRMIADKWELWIQINKNQGVAPTSFDHGFMNHDEDIVLYILEDPEKLTVKLENTYWQLFSQIPVHQELPPGVEKVMFDAMTYFSTDRLRTGEKSRSPYTEEQCEQLMSLYKTLKQETAERSAVRNWFVSVILHKIWDVRRKGYYGTFGAKTSVEPPEREPPNILQRLLDGVLFFLSVSAHERYRERLESAHDTGDLLTGTFQKQLAGTIQEWKDSNLLSTVFVLVNIAFLAVADIKDFQQTASIVSIIFSTASIVTGVYHLRTHQPKNAVDDNGTRRSLSLSSKMMMSFSLALPLVFLLWSIISFLIAILHFSFANYIGIPRDVLAPIAGTVMFITISVRVFFYRIWDEPDNTTLYWQIREAFRNSKFKRCLKSMWVGMPRRPQTRDREAP